MSVNEFKINGIELADALSSYLYCGDSSIYNTGDVNESKFDLENGKMPGYAVLIIVKDILQKVEDVIRDYREENFVIDESVIKQIEEAQLEQDDEENEE